MKMQKLAIAIAAMALSAGASAGTVDLFSTNQGQYSDSTATAGDTGLTITSGVGGSVNGGSDILGGNRDLFVSLLTTGGNVFANVSAGVGGGFFQFSTTTQSTARGQLQWDGAANTDETIDYTGLGGADLTAGGTLSNFALDIVFADLGFNFEITAYTNATNWTKVSLVANSHPSPITTLIPFSAFMNPFLCGVPNPAPGVLLVSCSDGAGNAGGTNVANLANLGALVADIDRFGGTTAVDLTLDGVRTVPEPGVLGLLGIGLLGFAAVARRQKKQA